MLQSSQENNCTRVSFLIKLQESAFNFFKKETLAQVFSVNSAKFLRAPFYITPPEDCFCRERIWIKIKIEFQKNSFFEKLKEASLRLHLY